MNDRCVIAASPEATGHPPTPTPTPTPPRPLPPPPPSQAFDWRTRRIAVVTPAVPGEPGAISGIPAAICEALRGLVGHVEVISPGGAERTAQRGAREARGLPLRAAGWMARRARRAVRDLGARELLGPDWAERRMLARARARSAEVSARLARARADAVIGLFASDLLFALDTDLPLLHFSDTTAHLLRQTYPAWRATGRGSRAAMDTIERGSLHRADVCVLASRLARRSALEDYGVSPERAMVVPMGATVVPAHAGEIRPAPPEGRDLRLCIVAADPIRKRTALAIACTERLARKGWNARLTIIGRDHPSLPRSARVEHLGPLRLADPSHRARHRAVLSTSHVLILPSLAEAWGIAPAEAAHFGRPSVVSAAGGLPEVVLHDQTGLVLPVDAGPEDYARAIDGLCRDPARYRRLSHAALDRARAEFTWTRCAERLVDAVATAVRGVATGQPPA